MSWKLGSPVKIATPNGNVFCTPAVHYHNATNHQALFTLASDGKTVLPFVVTSDYMEDDSLSDNLETVSKRLAAVR